MDITDVISAQAVQLIPRIGGLISNNGMETTILNGKHLACQHTTLSIKLLIEMR